MASVRDAVFARAMEQWPTVDLTVLANIQRTLDTFRMYFGAPKNDLNDMKCNFEQFHNGVVALSKSVRL